MKYKYIFIDSHVGGEEDLNGCAPSHYIMENELYEKSSVLIAHDYNKIRKIQK
jgi:hypothetical protein